MELATGLEPGERRPDRPSPMCGVSLAIPALTALALLAPLPLPAQTVPSIPARPEHTHIIDAWSIADGLPGSVTDVTESADGTLWLGTVAGFVRFDGESFDTYDRNRVRDLPWRRVSALAPGSDSSLWIFTDRGHVIRWSVAAITQRLEIGRDGLWPAAASVERTAGEDDVESRSVSHSRSRLGGSRIGRRLCAGAGERGTSQ